MDPAIRDFKEKDDLSDVALIVEDVPLYVHRPYLAEWSPVWKRMFVGDFSERTAKEIPLPGKKLSEIIELLHCIYPSQKPVTDETVDFILELTEEYQIDGIKKRCEAFLISKQQPSLTELLLAQKFNLPNLYAKCIDYAKRQTLEDLENAVEYKDLEPKTLIAIYKAKVNMIRDYSHYLSENGSALKRTSQKLQAEKDHMHSLLLNVQKLWDTPSKRCYKHMVPGSFDYSCRECNEKIHSQVKKVCSEAAIRRFSNSLTLS